MYRCAYRVVAHSKSDLPRPFRVGRFSWLRLKEFVSGAIALDFPQAYRAACISERRYDVWRRFAVEPSPELESADFRRGFSAMFRGGTSRMCRDPAFLR